MDAPSYVETRYSKVYAKFLYYSGEVSECISDSNLKIDPVSSISVGRSIVCAILKKDKSLKCWGHNNNGQLGQGNNVSIGSKTAGDGKVIGMGDDLLPIDL